MLEILEGNANWIYFAIGSIAYIVVTYATGWGTPWIGWAGLSIAACGSWRQYRRYCTLLALGAAHGINLSNVTRKSLSEDEMANDGDLREARQQLIAGAAEGITATGNGGILTPVDNAVEAALAEIYGVTWWHANEQLVRAMLTFVEDFRAFAGPDGQKLCNYFKNDPRVTALLNVFTCIEHLGVINQPTLHSGEPSIGAFTFAFGLNGGHGEGDRTAVGEGSIEEQSRALAGESTGVILMVAISIGIDARKQQAA